MTDVTTQRRALRDLAPLVAQGYRVKAGGECIRVSHDHKTLYFLVGTLITEADPCAYVRKTLEEV